MFDNYKFEYNDLRAVITLVNVILIMKYGLTISWLGLIIGIIGVMKDLTVDRKVNGLIMHFSNIILNVYFLAQL